MLAQELIADSVNSALTARPARMASAKAIAQVVKRSAMTNAATSRTTRTIAVVVASRYAVFQNLPSSPLVRCLTTDHESHSVRAVKAARVARASLINQSAQVAKKSAMTNAATPKMIRTTVAAVASRFVIAYPLADPFVADQHNSARVVKAARAAHASLINQSAQAVRRSATTSVATSRATRTTAVAAASRYVFETPSIRRSVRLLIAD